MSYMQSLVQCVPSALRTVFHVEGKSDGLMTKSMAVALLILSIFAIALNLGVATRIFKLRKRVCDYKPAFILIGNLAISDFLVGFFVFIMFCLDLSEFSTNWKDNCCGLFTAISVIACQETIFTIMLIAIDKYIFICHGLAYARIVTKKRICVMLSISWFYAIIIATSPAMGLRETVWCSCSFQEYISKGFAILLFITAVIIPLGIMGFLYSVILSLAIKLSKSKKTFNKAKPKSKFIRLSLLSRSSKSSRTRTTIVNIRPFIQTELELHTSILDKRRSRSDSLTNFISERQQILDKLPASRLNHQNIYEVDKDLLSNKLKLEDNTKLSDPLQIDDNDIECCHHSYDSSTSNSSSEGSITKETYDDIETSFINRKSMELTSTGVYTQAKNLEVYDLTAENRTRSLLEKEENDGTEEVEDFKIERTPRKKSVEKLSRSKKYLKTILSDARNKAGFLKRIKAIKTVFLIIASFTFTYVPFIISTLIYKSQNTKDEVLFQTLNSLLYCAVVGNSVINPFIYAYGYKEFRIQTKKFTGIFARESRPKL